MNIALYSAIYGSYDRPKPLPADLGVPAIMYTDNRRLSAPGWEVRYRPLGIATFNGDPRVTAPMLAHKWWKTHPDLAVPDADVTLWLDGSMTITVNDYVARCLAALGGDDWVTVTHPARDCVYDEAAFSALLPRYHAPSMHAQAAFYRDQIGHPAHFGLIATGANVRRHTPAVAELGRHWWWENVTRSHQDQLSLPVLLRLAGDAVRWNRNMPWGEWWHISEHLGGVDPTSGP